MVNPRDILNEIKWRENPSLDNIEIWIVHRGAPDDTKIISGENVSKIGKSFIHTTTTMIPFHRVFKIIYNGKTVFKR